MLKQFVSDVERARFPVVVIVPGAVIYELDACASNVLLSFHNLTSVRSFRQKHGTHDSLGWFARTASTWLLEKVKERRSVKAQAQDETCKESKNWKTRDSSEVRLRIYFPSYCTNLIEEDRHLGNGATTR